MKMKKKINKTLWKERFSISFSMRMEMIKLKVLKKNQNKKEKLVAPRKQSLLKV